MSGVQTIEVAADDADSRLDRWFRRLFPHVPQGRIEKMCRKGEIRVDGGRVKAATRLEAGQMVRVPPLPEPGEMPARPRGPRISEADRQMIRDAVIYRDAHIIALNKPAGLASQGGTNQVSHVDALAEELKFELDEKPRLVHRLDKDTSGVLLMGRTRKAAELLTRAFRARDTRKIYWALVAGVPSPNMGTIKYGLVKAGGHGARGEGEKMHCVHPRDVEKTPGAKHATTDYAVMSSLGKRCAWMALVPITGRTHQLRAHMAEIGHPIAGDGKYGGSRQENMGDGWGAGFGGEISKGLHLHARSLSFTHPFTQNRVTLTAKLGPHMAQSWANVDWHEADAPEDPFEELE